MDFNAQLENKKQPKVGGEGRGGESIDIREYKKNLARHKVQGEDDCA
jgi:hypothetical protein